MQLFDVSLATPRHSCLVVEDEALIGMALEASLEEAGYNAAGPFPSRASALAWLDSETPSFAILDYALQDGACVELARVLRQRSVPFIVYSGYRLSADVPPEFRGVTWIEKPVTREALIRAVAEMLPSAPNPGYC
jgi:two-component SAPR family response regulator